MQVESRDEHRNGGTDRCSDAETVVAAAEQSRGGPLLIDTIQGEEGGFPFAEAGQGLILIGIIALMAGILAALLSAHSLDMGWEGAWYVPRGELFFVLPMSLVLFATGTLLYFFGRRNGTD